MTYTEDDEQYQQAKREDVSESPIIEGLERKRKLVKGEKEMAVISEWKTIIIKLSESVWKKNKTGMDRFQDCCKV